MSRCRRETAQITSADWVLDLGCWTGQMAAVLASRVGSVLGIDPETDMLGGLRTRLTAEHADNVLLALATAGMRDIPGTDFTTEEQHQAVAGPS